MERNANMHKNRPICVATESKGVQIANRDIAASMEETKETKYRNSRM